MKGYVMAAISRVVARRRDTCRVPVYGIRGPVDRKLASARVREVEVVADAGDGDGEGLAVHGDRQRVARVHPRTVPVAR